MTGQYLSTEALKELAAPYERLGDEERQALEAAAPPGGSMEHNRGLVAGLCYALGALNGNGAQAEQLKKVAAVAAARVLRQEADAVRRYREKLMAEATPEKLREIEQEMEECLRTGRHVSLQQVIEEIEAKQRQGTGR
jgi:hypothetical protein